MTQEQRADPSVCEKQHHTIEAATCWSVLPHEELFHFTLYKRKKFGPGQLQLATGGRKTGMLYWTGKSSVKLISLISRENQIYASCVSVLVIRLLSAAQAPDGNAALKRCETRWYVFKKTPLPPSASTSQLTSEEIMQEKTRQYLD